MLSRDCSVPRPFFGFIIPGPAVTKNGLSVVGNNQPQQTFQIQQLNANHHEWVKSPYEADGDYSFFCKFCLQQTTNRKWEALLTEVVPSGS